MPVQTTLADAWPQAAAQAKPGEPVQDFLPVSEELLIEVARRIVVALDPEQVILFGSYAQGTANADSDVDILVIMATELPPAQRALAVCRLLRPRPFPVDIVVKTPAEIDAALATRDSFMTTLLNSGQTLVFEVERTLPISAHRL